MTIENMEDASTFVRPSCERVDLSNRFSDVVLEYKRQFAHIYFVRSQLMDERIKIASKKKWGNKVVVKKLAELKVNEKCCVIGTVFKSMELQPSILKEVSDEHHLQLQPPNERYTSDKDKLILEDLLQRITLTGNIVPGKCFTGSIVALCGSENENGQFVVEDYTYSGLPPQVQVPPTLADSKYVLLLSGLAIGGRKEKSLQIQLLIDYILGMLGGSRDNSLCSKIIHVIVAGNSLGKETLDRASQSKAKYLTYKSEASTVEAMKDLDYFISQLVPYVSVDLMCGENDLSNFILPQKPLHPCLFPFARKYHGSTFFTSSNPFECKIDGVHFLGTSGQNINNMRMYSDVCDGIELLSETLELQHLAPTAPDTLGSFPFYETDPFIINECPHIYFCGNQPKFSCRVKEGADGQKVLLVCVPNFNATSSAVLVNLKTFECENLCLNIDIGEETVLPNIGPEH